jgi:hypothetical protein
MNIKRYAAATAELLLIFPAALFMTALFVRNLQPLQFEPARTAARIVSWYAARPHVGLWVFLIGLPLVVLVTGGGIIWWKWREEAALRQAARQMAATLGEQLATVLIAGATLAAGGFLAIVALHVLTD